MYLSFILPQSQILDARQQLCLYDSYSLWYIKRFMNYFTNLGFYRTAINYLFQSDHVDGPNLTIWAILNDDLGLQKNLHNS